MIYAFTMLKNTKTNRWHPIMFRPSPRPSESFLEDKLMRWRSGGHHTEGFDTEQQALDSIKADKDRLQGQASVFYIGGTYEWDGEEIPAMTLNMPPIPVDVPMPQPAENA